MIMLRIIAILAAVFMASGAMAMKMDAGVLNEMSADIAQCAKDNKGDAKAIIACIKEKLAADMEAAKSEEEADEVVPDNEGKGDEKGEAGTPAPEAAEEAVDAVPNNEGKNDKAEDDAEEADEDEADELAPEAADKAAEVVPDEKGKSHDKGDEKDDEDDEDEKDDEDKE